MRDLIPSRKQPREVSPSSSSSFQSRKPDSGRVAFWRRTQHRGGTGIRSGSRSSAYHFAEHLPCSWLGASDQEDAASRPSSKTGFLNVKASPWPSLGSRPHSPRSTAREGSRRAQRRLLLFVYTCVSGWKELRPAGGGWGGQQGGPLLEMSHVLEDQG